MPTQSKCAQEALSKGKLNICCIYTFTFSFGIIFLRMTNCKNNTKHEEQMLTVNIMTFKARNKTFTLFFHALPLIIFKKYVKKPAYETESFLPFQEML